MKYEQLRQIINGGDNGGAVSALSVERREIEIEKYKKQWDPEKHDVTDRAARPDKEVGYTDIEDGQEVTRKKTVPLNRIPVPMQKNIVGKAVTFLFGNPVQITAQIEESDKSGQLVLDAVKRVLSDNKSDSQNRVIAKHLFKSTQVAEVWLAEKAEPHDDYGFNTDLKLRQSIFSPWDGDQLFPLFDDHGDLIAFSRQFVIKGDDNKNITCFETYTKDEYIIWKQYGSGWERDVEASKPNPIGRIPVVFAEQEETEWYDVQRAIDRLEKLLSNHGDTNDYNGSPTVVIKGELVSMPGKGEAGKILEVGEKGDVQYLSWDQAPESVKLEIGNLFKIIHTYTQTPDISFENIKGSGPISGIALRFLFMDAHLKVLDKREIFDPYLKRRANILKTYVGYMNQTDSSIKAAAAKLNIETEIFPYTIEDLKEKVDILLAANGGKPIISQKASVSMANLVDNHANDYEQIQQEESTSQTQYQFET